jgi:ATP-binding cassette subfamily B protein/subfamily B ATP-binding cassette protein MsbA
MCLAANRPGIGLLDPLFSLPAPLLLLVACIGLVIPNLGAGADAAAQLHDDPGRPEHGQRSAQRLSMRISSACRSPITAASGSAILMYRITADSFAVQTMIMNGVLPILSAVILLAGMLIVLFRWIRC